MASRLVPARRSLRALAVLTAAALPTALIVHAASAQPSTHRVTIPGSAVSWTSHARLTGSPRASAPIHFNVVLRLHRAAKAERVARAVSDPNNARYGHYLTAHRFNSRFAPRAARVRAVESFLRGQGVTVNGVAAGNRWVSATGSVAQVQHAFATTLHLYSYQGRTLRASSGALSVPANLRSSVLGVLGVSQTASLRKPADAQPPPSTCSTFWDQHEQVGPPAYGEDLLPDPQLRLHRGPDAWRVRVAEGREPGQHRQGRDRRDHRRLRLTDHAGRTPRRCPRRRVSRSSPRPQYTETLMTPFGLQDECGGEAGWNEEESLDVEAVHAMAPAAKIHYVGASDCDTGIDAAVNYVIQHHVADLVSNSYGFLGEDGLGSEVATEDSMFVQAAAEGIGFYFSSGDFGDNTTIGAPHPEPDFPASDPWVTGVGGNSLGITSSSRYLFETAWGNDLDPVDFATSPSSYNLPLPGSFLSGTGGGVSALFKEPLYQKLDVPKSLATLNGSTPMRVVPDIAADADPETGFLIRARRIADPDRWHQPGLPADRWCAGGRQPGPAAPARVRDTVAVRPGSGERRVPRRQGAVLTAGDDDRLGSQPAQHGARHLADVDQGVRRHDGARHPERQPLPPG